MREILKNCKSQGWRSEGYSFEKIRKSESKFNRQKIAQKSDNLFLSNLAGTAGFEPANAGTKTQCLTAWRRPTIARTMTIIARQPEKIHTS